MSDRDRAATIQLKVRMKEPMRKRIEEEAQGAGWSMSAEIVNRLDRSFLGQDFVEQEFGDRRTYELMQMLALLKKKAEAETGKSVFSDFKTSVMAKAAMRYFINNFIDQPRPADAAKKRADWEIKMMAYHKEHPPELDREAIDYDRLEALIDTGPGAPKKPADPSLAPKRRGIKLGRDAYKLANNWLIEVFRSG